MPSTASLTWRPRISATLCAIIPPAPVAVLPPPAQGRLDRVAVLSEPGSTRDRHELAIGATDETCLVGLRQSLVSNYIFRPLLRLPGLEVQHNCTYASTTFVRPLFGCGQGGVLPLALVSGEGEEGRAELQQR